MPSRVRLICQFAAATRCGHEARRVISMMGQMMVVVDRGDVDGVSDRGVVAGGLGHAHGRLEVVVAVVVVVVVVLVWWPGTYTPLIRTQHTRTYTTHLGGDCV